MKTKLFFSILIAVLLLPLSIKAKAKEEKAPFISPSSTTAAGEISQEKNKEIKKIREEIKKAVQEKLNQVINRKKKRGWMGTIKKKSKLSLTIENKKGEVREVFYDEETKIINLKRKKFSPADLVVGKRILAMGYLEEENRLNAKRIVLLGPAKERKVRVVFGIVSDKSKASKLIVITPPKNKEETIELMIKKETEIILKNNKIGGYDDLSPAQKLVVIYSSRPSEINLALKIKIVASK